jgi:hypothetical protein
MYGEASPTLNLKKSHKNLLAAKKFHREIDNDEEEELDDQQMIDEIKQYKLRE